MIQGKMKTMKVEKEARNSGMEKLPKYCQMEFLDPISNWKELFQPTASIPNCEMLRADTSCKHCLTLVAGSLHLH